MINVYIEPHYWTGKLKTRCNVCHRVAYEDEETAKAVAEKISERYAMVAIFDLNCKQWHVTKKRGKYDASYFIPV